MESEQTFQKKKHFLMRYRDSVSKIEHLISYICTLEQETTYIKSIKYDQVPASAGTYKTSNNIVTKKIDHELQLKKAKQCAEKCKQEIIEVIYDLDNIKHIQVLEKYFIDCCELFEIAVDLNYTLRYTKKLYSDAIKDIKLPENK